MPFLRTRNKNAFQKGVSPQVFNQIPSKYGGIMTGQVGITDIILVNFGPHFHFWQSKNSRCQKCHALGKIKDALGNKIKDYYANVTSKTIFIPNKSSYNAD